MKEKIEQLARDVVRAEECMASHIKMMWPQHKQVFASMRMLVEVMHKQEERISALENAKAD